MSLNHVSEYIDSSNPIAWLKEAAPPMTRKSHIERPGTGVLFWVPDRRRKSERSPDFTGFIVLKHDYKAGQRVKIVAWKHPTSIGTDLLALAENDSKYEDWGPQEVPPDYDGRGRRKTVDDEDFEVRE